MTISRSTLFETITAGYFVIALAGVLGSASAWAASRPVNGQNTVLGASTITLAKATDTLPAISVYPSLPSSTPNWSIAAREYALYHVESGKVVAHSVNLDPVPIASTTKLASSLLIVKHLPLNQVITISHEASHQTGSLMNIREGEQLTVDDLLHGMLMVSGNDAAYQLAETTGGMLLGNPDAPYQDRIARFVNEMNSLASQLNLSSTHYMDPVGLNDNGHSNAVDLAKVASMVAHEPTLARIASTANTTLTDQAGHVFTLTNSNRLVTEFNFPGAGIGKTGFTPAAGHCLVAEATQNGNTFIAVVLNTYSTTPEASALAARDLLNRGFTLTAFQ